MTKSPLLFLLIVAAALPAALSCHAADAEKKPAVDEKAVRLQVWLDRENFGPGKIDGKGGEFTSKALALYQEAHPETKVQDAVLDEFREPTLTEYQIRDEDSMHVGKVPESKEEQAKLKALPYASLADLVAERFHADPDLLSRLNPEMKLAALKTGDVVKVPNVVPFEIEKLREEGKTKAPAEPSPRSVEILAKEESLRVLENGKVIAAFPVTVGSERLPAPTGSWKVEKVVTLPDFRWDLEMLNEGKRGTNALTLPPGPRNPVGTYWMGLNKEGVGIHGTDSPWSIGRSESHGCVRLSNWDAAKVAAMMTPGVRVEIR